MANEKILVVDDDTNICELLRLYLTKEGYQVTVANDGEEGLEKFNAVKPDMVLLDVMMPRMDGLEVCRRIRKAGNTPVMMLTAKGETFDKVLGLELGADDYMVKPFDAKEVVARIKAVLRRCQTTSAAAESTEGVIEFDNLRLDMNSYELRVMLYGWKKNGKHQWYTGRKETTIWEFDKPKKNGDHPTMKPIALLAYPIMNSSMSNAVVLDPFGGSGSTLIACEQSDRICYTVELDEKFCDVIVKRYIEQVGSSDGVTVQRDGVTFRFDEVANVDN